MKDLIAALRMAQYEIKGAHKDSKNPHFKSNYADYESVWNAVREPLLKNKLCITHMMDGKTLITRLMHDNGEHIESKYPIMVKDETNPQHFKAAITYAKRANLEGLTGCPSTDDDDGNSAAGLKVTPTFYSTKVAQEFSGEEFVIGNPAHKFLLNEVMKKSNLYDKITKNHLDDFKKHLDKFPPKTTDERSLNEFLHGFMDVINVSQIKSIGGP